MTAPDVAQIDAPVSTPPRLGLVEHPADHLSRLARDFDGLEFLRAIRDGELPPAPIADLLGFAPRDVDPGHVTFVLEPSQEHYNPIGSVHGGVIATVLDTVMGCALHSTLPKGTGYTTLDISIRYARPVTVQTGPVTAIGEIVHKGRRTATAEARLVDGLGRVLATGTSTLLVVAP
jgi:uncharacterized protein (TIGR00369 family)